MTMSKITVLDILGKLQRKKSIMESILVNPDWNLLKWSLPKIFLQAIPKILRTAFPVCVFLLYCIPVYIESIICNCLNAKEHLAQCRFKSCCCHLAFPQLQKNSHHGVAKTFEDDPALQFSKLIFKLTHLTINDSIN